MPHGTVREVAGRSRNTRGEVAHACLVAHAQRAPRHFGPRARLAKDRVVPFAREPAGTEYRLRVNVTATTSYTHFDSSKWVEIPSTRAAACRCIHRGMCGQSALNLLERAT